MSGVIPRPEYNDFNSSAVLKVPSSFMAWIQGIFFAPGMCPPLCACSAGYSGGAVISPLNSFWERTSTRPTSTLLNERLTSSK